MVFRLEFDTDNAAFEDNEGEISDILYRVATRVKGGARSGAVYDSYGNFIGRFVHAQS